MADNGKGWVWEALAQSVGTMWRRSARYGGGLTTEEIVQAARIGIMRGLAGDRQPDSEHDKVQYLRRCAINMVLDTIPEVVGVSVTHHQNTRAAVAKRVRRVVMSVVQSDSAQDDGSEFVRNGGDCDGFVVTEDMVLSSAQPGVVVTGRQDNPASYEDTEFLHELSVHPDGGLSSRKALAIFQVLVDGVKDDEAAEDLGLTVRNMRYQRTKYREIARKLK